MKEDGNALVVRKLDHIAATLRHLLAVELARAGASQSQIAAHLKTSKSTVVQMLRGVKKSKGMKGDE